MISELKKTCLDNIERILSNISQIQLQVFQTQIKSVLQHKLYSLQNDVQLLKDNFILIMSKVVRVQNKANERQSFILNLQTNYHLKQEEMNKNYRILQSKYEKLMKELKFVKFSNKNLRDQLQGGKQRKNECKNLREIVRCIGEEIKESNQGIQEKIKKILRENGKYENTPEKVEKFSTKNWSPVKDEQFEIFEEFELRTNERISEKKQISFDKNFEQQKTKKKKTREQNGYSSSDKKKREELAKLVEQQGKLTKFRERYLSTDLV